MTFNWTREHVETLTRMWAGGETASAIGEAIGCSRNAAIGKVHRLGLHLVDVCPERQAARAAKWREKADEAIQRAVFAFRRAEAERARMATQRPEPAAAIALPPKPPPAPRATPAPAIDYRPPPGGITIMDLRDSTCRWPLWPHDARPCPDTARYCGARIPVGTVYCACHAAVACGAGSPSERRAHRVEAA